MKKYCDERKYHAERDRRCYYCEDGEDEFEPELNKKEVGWVAEEASRLEIEEKHFPHLLRGYIYPDFTEITSNGEYSGLREQPVRWLRATFPADQSHKSGAESH